MRIIYREIIEYIITLQMKRHAHGTRRHARLWSKTLSGYNDTPHLMTPCVGFYLGLWISSAYGGPQRYCFGILLFCFVLAKKLLYLYFVWSNEWFFSLLRSRSQPSSSMQMMGNLTILTEPSHPLQGHGEPVREIPLMSRCVVYLSFIVTEI